MVITILVLSLLDGAIFRQTLKDFGCERLWTPTQASEILTRTVEVIGSVTQWRIDHFQEIGHLVRG